MTSLAFAAAIALAAAPTAKAPTTPHAAVRPAGTTAASIGSPARVLPQLARVAIMPLSSLGSTDQAARAIERIFLGELKKLLGDRLVTTTELGRGDAWLPANVATCEGELDCLVEVFGGYGWPAFVVGNVTGLGNDRVINLKLIDVASGGELRRAASKASGDESTLIVEMRKAAVELVAPELLVGVVELRAAQPGVQILVDGQLVGRTPLAAPRLTLAAGRHAVEASGEGLVTFSKMIDLGYGETIPLTIDLPASSVWVGGSAPFRSRWWPWAIAAVGAASAATGGYFYYQHLHTADDISRLYAKGELDWNRATLRGRWEQDLELSRGFGAAGALLLLGSATLFTIDLL